MWKLLNIHSNNFLGFFSWLDPQVFHMSQIAYCSSYTFCIGQKTGIGSSRKCWITKTCTSPYGHGYITCDKVQVNRYNWWSKNA